MFTEIINIYCENHTKYINTLYEEYEKLLNFFFFRTLLLYLTSNLPTKPYLEIT
jgi:hypothetical protein